MSNSKTSQRLALSEVEGCSVVGDRFCSSILPSFHPSIFSLLLAAGMMLAGTAWGAVNTTTGSGSWTTAGIWSDGEPTSDDDVHIRSGDTVTISGTTAISINSLTITGTLTHAANSTYPSPGEANKINLQIANGFTLDAAGAINVDGKGYNAGQGPGKQVSGAGGGGYGGHGGNWDASGQLGGLTYGSATAPTNIGSGGYSDKGGGAVIISSGAATINGAISAKGNASGSGGTIYITCSSITGNGSLRCDGSDGNPYSGGGGGRVAVVVTGGDLSGFSGSMTAYGGKEPSTTKYGAGGTIYKQTSTQGAGHGDLVIDYNNNATTFGEATDIPAGATWTVGNLILKNKGFLGVLSGSTQALDGVSSPDSSLISGLVMNGGTLSLGGGTLTVNKLQFIVNAPSVLNGNLVLTNGATMSHFANGSTEANKINLTINGNFTLASDATVNVDGKGYAAKQGDGKPVAGGGAAHGGQGGTYDSGNVGGLVTYGSITAPTNCGSGGYDGGGGGAIILSISGAATLNGTNSAKGATANSGGAGGSIYITCGSLSGSGTLLCDGGGAAWGGGGGGRVAVVVTNSGADFSGFTGSMTALGGGGSSAATRGAVGTVYRRAANQPYGDLIVNQTDSGIIGATTLIGPKVVDAVVGNVFLVSNAVLRITNQTLTVYGSWSNGASFLADAGGTVVLAGTGALGTNTLFGATTFGSLSCTTAGKTLLFESGKTNTILTALNITGASGVGNPISLLPATAGQQWFIKATNTFVPTLSYLIVSNSTAVTNANGQSLAATFSTFNDVGVSNSLNSNTNWSFPAPADKVWVTTAGTSWGIDGNWSPSGVPLATDFSITIPSGGNQPVLNASYTYPCPLTIQSGATLTLNGWNLTINGVVTNQGTIIAGGAETVTFGSNVVFTGATAFTPAQSTVKINGSAAQSFSPANNTFYVLNLANTNAIAVTDAFTTRDLTFPASTASVTFASGFTATNVTLSVSNGASLTFAAGQTYTVRSALILRGTSGKLVTLRSSATSAWKLNVNGYTDVLYVDAAYSDANDGIRIYAVGSTDSLNNQNWDFGAGRRWVGTSETWTTAGNWLPGNVPVGTNYVMIYSPYTTAPRLTGQTTIAGLTVGGLSGAAALTVDAPLTVTGNVVLAENATITHTANAATELYKVNLSVGGNLTEYATAVINVDGKGYATKQGDGKPVSAAGGGAHGGQGGTYDANNVGGVVTYGSITAPTNCGSGAWDRGGGGAIILSISGAATLNGTNSAKGDSSSCGGAGGSIYITCGSLSGSGTLLCDGARAVYAGSGGGRVAVVVTNSGADFSGFTGSMTALGGSGETTTQGGAAGTVYRKAANQTYGDLIVNQTDSGIIGATTLIGSKVVDAVVGNVQLLNYARLAVSDGCMLTVNGSWSNAVGAAAMSGGTVVFAGTSPATVWGGNTWSNLTIATANKIVSFEAGKTQAVYGTPTFDNGVTLQSTAANSWWYLTKPGSSTQDVGKVSVQDSNATNNMTFRGAVGSVDQGHNVNWLFLGSRGTVILLR